MSATPSDVQRRVFRAVHTDLPREAPGSRACTQRALSLLEGLPDAPRVLDVGCGPGAQTLDLAGLLPRAHIEALDAHEPFVRVAQERVRAAGLQDRVTVVIGDMRRLDDPDESFDLLWCEGAAYVMGVADALAAWRRLLKPGGCIGFTEAVWLTDSPPEQLARWWAEAYPKMGSIDDCLGIARRAGFEVLGHFVLPEAAWWDDYYAPMERRLSSLADDYRSNPTALAALAGHQREVDYYRRWSAHYGYVFVVGRRPESG